MNQEREKSIDKIQTEITHRRYLSENISENQQIS